MTDEERDQAYADGYRQAVLDCTRCLCSAEHVGDVRRSMKFVWQASGLPVYGPPKDEYTGGVDEDRLDAMGARPCYEIEGLSHDRQARLVDLVGAATTGYPHEYAVDPDALADVLGIRIQRSVDNDHVRVDPDTLPRWYENAYASDVGIEWEF